MFVNYLKPEAGPVCLDVETGEDRKRKSWQRHPTDHFPRHVQVEEIWQTHFTVGGVSAVCWRKT